MKTPNVQQLQVEGTKLNEHQKSTVVSLLGVLEIPLETMKFTKVDSHTVPVHRIVANGEGFNISIDTNEFRPGYFWMIIKCPKPCNGWVCEVRVRGKVGAESMMLDTVNHSFAFVQVGKDEDSPLFDINCGEGVSQILTRIGFEKHPEFKTPHELENITREDAAERLLALARHMIGNGL